MELSWACFKAPGSSEASFWGARKSCKSPKQEPGLAALVIWLYEAIAGAKLKTLPRRPKGQAEVLGDLINASFAGF